MKKREFKVCILGHFGFGKQLLNGQTIKTKIVTDELERQLGKSEVLRVDTAGGLKTLIKIFFQCFYYFSRSKNIIMLPAQNGLRVFSQMLVFFNVFLKKRLHYIVIGGWLPEYLQRHRIICRILKNFYGIYVETATMKKSLDNSGFENVIVMPNCKPLNILKESELKNAVTPPYRFCTFSRVMKEKGIENAINAVKEINNDAGYELCNLDIYGQIDNGYLEQFKRLKKNFPEYIHYIGVVDFHETTKSLKEYYALLFPTYYDGEGFAGTIIDAFAAGIPVIASDWRYNSEIVDQFKTGIVYPCAKAKTLIEAMQWMMQNEEIMSLKKNSLLKSKIFLPENILQILIKELK